MYESQRQYRALEQLPQGVPGRVPPLLGHVRLLWHCSPPEYERSRPRMALNPPQRSLLPGAPCG